MLFSITAGMPGFMACACRRLHKFSIPAIWLLMLGADRANAQTVCGSVPEGGTLTLTAPAGQVFTSIVFASYGTPTGSCGSYATSSCHAATSVSVVSSVLVGNNSGSIPATNGTFGDPCSGTVKLLAVEAAYGPSLPLTLLSFTGNSLANGDIRLSWQTANEYLTDRFLVEASANASSFTGLGQVAAAGRGGNRYSFTIQAPLAFADGFYRLKMQDVDERFTYSPIIHVRKSAEPASGFRVVTNPISTILRIAGLSGPGRAILLSAHGSLLQQVSFSGDRLDMDMGKYASGLYIIRIQNNQEWITRKLVKE